jgi:hypothetical protein
VDPGCVRHVGAGPGAARNPPSCGGVISHFYATWALLSPSLRPPSLRSSVPPGLVVTVGGHGVLGAGGRKLHLCQDVGRSGEGRTLGTGKGRHFAAGDPVGKPRSSPLLLRPAVCQASARVPGKPGGVCGSRSVWEGVTCQGSSGKWSWRRETYSVLFSRTGF